MQSKAEHFDERLIEMADFARALGHPARLAILQTLAARTTCVCGELVDELPLAQATVSQHLKALKEAGLVQGEIDGPRTCYCLNVDSLQRLADTLEAFMVSIRPRCCS